MNILWTEPVDDSTFLPDNELPSRLTSFPVSRHGLGFDPVRPPFFTVIHLNSARLVTWTDQYGQNLDNHQYLNFLIPRLVEYVQRHVSENDAVEAFKIGLAGDKPDRPQPVMAAGKARASTDSYVAHKLCHEGIFVFKAGGYMWEYDTLTVFSGLMPVDVLKQTEIHLIRNFKTLHNDPKCMNVGGGAEGARGAGYIYVVTKYKPGRAPQQLMQPPAPPAPRPPPPSASKNASGGAGGAGGSGSAAKQPRKGDAAGAAQPKKKLKTSTAQATTAGAGAGASTAAAAAAAACAALGAATALGAGAAAGAAATAAAAPRPFGRPVSEAPAHGDFTFDSYRYTKEDLAAAHTAASRAAVLSGKTLTWRMVAVQLGVTGNGLTNSYKTLPKYWAKLLPTMPTGIAAAEKAEK